MTEGWLNDEYLILFSEEESNSLSGKYKLAKYLPGHTLIGLRFWDDFIVIDADGAMRSLPTLPLDSGSAASFALPNDFSLKPDDRFSGKIRWFVEPLIFGGDPKDKANVAWVTQEQHAELVVWWNDQYQTIKAQSSHA
jgi:hypothetical protein